VHAPQFHFLKIRLNIILPSKSGSSKWSLSIGFPHPSLVCTYHTSHTCYMHSPSHSPRVGHLNNIWWGVKIIKLLISPLPCYLVPLRPKYYPQNPIFKHPQTKFRPQCEWLSFTPIQNNRLNYSFVYLNVYIFGYQPGRQRILHRLIASIPWLRSVLHFFLNRILMC
jgi:hypothetical protein